jgi:hypothetical protein
LPREGLYERFQSARDSVFALDSLSLATHPDPAAADVSGRYVGFVDFIPQRGLRGAHCRPVLSDMAFHSRYWKAPFADLLKAKEPRDQR